MKKAIFALMVLFISGTAYSQDTKVQEFGIYDKGYVGFAYLSKSKEGNWGLMGGWIRYYEKYKLSLLLEGSLDLNFSKREDSDRYYWDEFSNGQRRCRDSQSGQFASNAYCELEVNPSIRLSSLINYHFNLDEKMDFIAGVGYMISNHSTPILSIGLTQKPDRNGVSGSLGFGKEYIYFGLVYIF